MNILRNDLTPGTNYYVSIQDKLGEELYRQEIDSPDKAKKFMDQYGKSVEGASILQAEIMPIRTDSLGNLSKDLFLPTVVNHALKVKNVGLRIFATVPAFILDAVTFIPRLITTPFRMLYNNAHKPPEHDLIKLIKDNPKAKNALKEGIIEINIITDVVKIEKVGDRPIGKETITKTRNLVLTKVLPGSHSKQETLWEENQYTWKGGTQWEGKSVAHGRGKDEKIAG